jgi:methionyl-tRNA formyltransferase
VKEAAIELGLPVLQPESMTAAETQAEVRQLHPAVIVSAAYGQILRPAILEIPPRGVLNVHPSLLPRWRGASPIPATILAGDDETGVSIMLMDAGMDTGPVLSSTNVRTSADDTTGTLTEKLAVVGADLLVDTLPRWLTSEIEPEPQDESRASTTQLVRKEDGLIDWFLPAINIWRAVRAYNPWPGAQGTLENGEVIFIWSGWPLDLPARAKPGTIVELGPPERALIPESASSTTSGLYPGVQTGSGVLALTVVQRSGRKAIASEDFLRGWPGLIGQRFVRLTEGVRPP